MKRLVALRWATFFLLLLAVGLGIVTIQSMNGVRRWSEQVNSAMAGYVVAQRSIHLDLLNERAGLLRNYDRIDADLTQARESLEALGQANLSPQARKKLEDLVAKNKQQEKMVGQFNSDNALLQTALLYFTYHAGTSADTQILINRILKMTLDTSPKTVREAQQALQKMPTDSVGAPSARPNSYARLLVEILPEIDRLLSDIRTLDVNSASSALQEAVQDEMLARALRIQQLELALSAAVLLLIVATTSFLLAQRAQTRELQARAANERLSAAIAIPLIEAGAGTFRSRIQEATDRLALHIGARRLQIMVPGIGDSLQFTTSGEELAPDWLSKLAAAADIDDRWVDDRVVASCAKGPADDALVRAMRETGINALILLRTADPFRVVMGFEPEDLAMAQRSDHLAGLSSAMIAIAHRARREIMQLEHERLEQSLAEERRMASLGAIASGVAHNCNNIISAIAGFSEIGQRRTKSGSVPHKSFDEIQGAVERARDLVDAILNYARQRRSSKSPFNLCDLLTQTVRMLSVSSSNKATFDLAGANDPHIVFGSQSDLQQVVLNIANNAAFVSKGQTVRIRVQRANLGEKRQMSHGNLFPGQYAVVTITDSGPGIPEARLPQLFEPFFTTKSGGTGLGLSTAWEIVQQHGGTIHVQKAQDGGAAFSIWLPEVQSGEGSAIIGNGARILLLADADRLLDEEDLLAEFGYEPRGFPLTTKIETLSEELPNADVVLIATMHPSKASEMATSIAPMLKGRPLLLATMDSDNWQHGLPTVALSYPIRADELSAQLTRALSG